MIEDKNFTNNCIYNVIRDVFTSYKSDMKKLKKYNANIKDTNNYKKQLNETIIKIYPYLKMKGWFKLNNKFILLHEKDDPSELPIYINFDTIIYFKPISEESPDCGTLIVTQHIRKEVKESCYDILCLLKDIEGGLNRF